jgi:hypothetical protein
METNLPAKYLGTPLDGILQEEAAANAHSGQPSNQNQHPAAASLEDNATPDVELGEVNLDNATPGVELDEVDLDNTTTPGVELGEDPEVEKKHPASAGVKVEIPNNAAVPFLLKQSVSSFTKQQYQRTASGPPTPGGRAGPDQVLHGSNRCRVFGHSCGSCGRASSVSVPLTRILSKCCTRKSEKLTICASLHYALKKDSMHS